MLYNQDKFIEKLVIDNFHKDIKQPPNLLEYTKKINGYISNITKELKKTYISGPDMNAILYLLRTLLLSSTDIKKDIASPSSNIKKWITSLNKLPVKSVGGWVYIATIFHTSFEIVIKTPKVNSTFERTSLLREYAIANIGINRLRYNIPTFIYTFDIFTCNPPDKHTGELKIENMCLKSKQTKSLYIMCEKVEGKTMRELIKTGITFEDWLFVFLQVLLSLEIAQRKLNFTHFDLHTGNTIIQTNKKISYSINIDATTYSIKNSNLTPVIIDFGHSTVKLDGKTVGASEFPEYGMVDFMVPGYDMYKFLCFSANDAKFYKNNTLFNQLVELFNFYGTDDSLNISKTKEKGIQTTIKEFCREGSYTNVAKYTPLMFFDWISKNYGYLIPYKSRNILEIPRNNFLNISYSNYLKDYNDFFGEIEIGVQDAIRLIERCITTKSYILSIYNISILEKLNTHLKSEKLKRYIKSKKDIIENKAVKKIFIDKDIEIIERVFNISIPNQKEIDDAISEVLRINIRHNNPKDKVNSTDKLLLLTQYEKELGFYLQIYYTILEINLKILFKSWLDRFLSSDIFIFYKKNNLKVKHALRWSTTVLESINK